MFKRKQERIYSRFLEQERIDSRLKELKEMESVFPPEKEELNDSCMTIEECERILGITPGASLYEIKLAYRDLVKVWHPDKYEETPRLRDKAAKQLKQINMAYDMLFQLFSEREQASKEHEHKSRKERQRQEHRGAKQKGERSGQRERIPGRGSLTVLKCPSCFLWRSP